jgi:hypothetical protein
LNRFRQIIGKAGGANDISPAIVPPMLGKSSLAQVITRQWKAAIDALANAREIWVIGYSFPATDAFMKRLLTEGVKRNRDLQKIWIVDIQRYEAWQARVEDLFPPTIRSARVEFLCYPALLLCNKLMDHFGDSNLQTSLRELSSGYRNAVNNAENSPEDYSNHSRCCLHVSRVEAYLQTGCRCAGAGCRSVAERRGRGLGAAAVCPRPFDELRFR